MKSHMTLAVYACLVAFGCVIRFSPGGAHGSDFIAALARVRPHERPAEERLGYYEHLAAAAQPGRRPSWETRPDNYESCFEDAKGDLGPLLRRAPNSRGFLYVPNASAVCFGGVAWHTNRFGFRGADWSDAPAPGVTRIVVMGSSDVSGFGVAAEDAFPARLEKLLDGGAAGARYEVLNAGVIGFSARDQMDVIDDVLGLSPSVVLFASLGDADEAIEPCRRIADAARDRNASLLWAEIPDIRGGEAPAKTHATRELEVAVSAAGFRVVSLADAFTGQDPLELWAHEYDPHLGSVAHELVARRLAERLAEDRSLLFATSSLAKSPSPRQP